MDTSLSGKVAIVTGASRGIGRAYAQALAAAGATVVATARTFGGDPDQSLAGVAASSASSAGTIWGFGCDLRNEADIVRLVEQTHANFGRIDILVNNAGMYPHYDPLKVTQADWEANHSLNVLAPYFTIREVTPVMKEGGGGSIINMTSLSARPTDPVEHALAHDGLMVYGVTKAGLDRITSYFAAHLAPMNISVNGLSPGGVLTESWREADPEAYELGRAEGWAFEPVPEVVGPPLLALAVKTPESMTGQLVHATTYEKDWS